MVKYATGLTKSALAAHHNLTTVSRGVFPIFLSFLLRPLCSPTPLSSHLLPRHPQIFNQWSSTASSHSVVLLLAQVMGMYFVSSVLLMRMNLPPKYRYVKVNRCVRCVRCARCAQCGVLMCVLVVVDD